MRRAISYPKTIDEFLLLYAMPIPEAGCWIFEGKSDAHGYGRFCSHQKVYAAHRVAFQLVHGDIPPSNVICHRCDVPGCVNPKHLFAGSQANNMRDCVSKRRHHWAKATHCIRGHLLPPFRPGKMRQCRLCQYELLALKGNSPRFNPTVTHCKHGHEYTSENSYFDKKGRRYCRNCHRIREAKRMKTAKQILLAEPNHLNNKGTLL